MELKEIKRLEDFIAFKYQNPEAYKEYQKSKKDLFDIPIIIPINGTFKDVFIQDVEVEEFKQDNRHVFKMEAILLLSSPLIIDNELVDVISVKKTCYSEKGCTHIDWSRVSCLWVINKK